MMLDDGMEIVVLHAGVEPVGGTEGSANNNLAVTRLTWEPSEQRSRGGQGAEEK